MDTFIISKISNYFSTLKNFQLSKSIKNKAISKIFIEKCVKETCFVVEASKQGLKFTKIPSLKQTEEFTNIDFSDVDSVGFKNHLFLYKEKEKKIHAFQISPLKYNVINIQEEISGEISLYEINSTSAWITVNSKSAYKIVNLNLEATKTFTAGFGEYEHLIIENKLYADYAGEEMIVQDLEMDIEYRLKFKNFTYIDILSKDLVIIDFCYQPDVLDGVLPVNSMNDINKKNCLFKFHLIPSSKSISLEFVSFLAEDVRPFKISPKEGLWYSRTDTFNKIELYSREKRFAVHEQPGFNECFYITNLGEDSIIIQFTKEIILIDVLTGQIGKKIDLRQTWSNLRYIGPFDLCGQYFNALVVLDEEDEELDGSFRYFVLDMDFKPIIEIKHDSFTLASD